MGPLQVLSRSSYWCSLSTPPLLLTHSPKMWLGETFQYTDHLRLTNRHPNPLHCHFYLISSSLHQNLGTSVASFVLRRLLHEPYLREQEARKITPGKSSATRLVCEQLCLVTKMIKLFGFSFKIHFMCARWSWFSCSFCHWQFVFASHWSLVTGFQCISGLSVYSKLQNDSPSVIWGLLWIEHQRSLWVSLCLSRLIPAIRVFLNPF